MPLQESVPRIIYVCPTCGWWEGDRNGVGEAKCNGWPNALHKPVEMDQIEVVPLDDSFSGLMGIAETLLERHYPAEFFNRDNPIVGDDPGTQLVVALRACKETMARG